MFAYCGNNPVSRKDEDGESFETVFDVISLTLSIADVANNPSSVWAWAGLIGDIVDVAVPFVSGVGEATKALSASSRLSEVAVVVSSATAIAPEAVDYFVTPDGDAVPSTLSGFNENLSKLQYKDGKYYGIDGNNEPVRIRVEMHDANPNYTGKKNPFHEVPHFHIDRKANKSTGKWLKRFTGFLSDLF